MEIANRTAIERFVAKAAGAATVEITVAKLMSGGAVQENWMLHMRIAGGQYDGHSAFVLRCDSATAGVAISRNRSEEFRLLRVVFEAGVTVPEPLWLCEDRSVIGRPFFIMRHVAGVASGHVLVKDLRYAPDRRGLGERLGAELAKIHAIRPPEPQLAFLETYDEAPATHHIAQYRNFLDRHHTAYPALEWGLRWLERHAPPRGRITLCHGDFRTGNYMVDEKGLTGILDWEFAAWSDPMEDIGWFCAKCWRFGNVAAEAGGVADRADFLRGYERQAGRSIEQQMLHYWEVMAHVKWAIIAIQQAERQQSGEEDSLLLALTGHIVPELEWDILNMTENG